ncbi:MAG: SDR family NAD(P)-dependent oxidoreductase [Myxococcales bacterium]|nr:SDR family NAD(P)-dependent oxidoreductase [Myxococcales bacterium]
MKELKDRVAVVTGGASGIGLAMARRFGREGMKLVVADIERAALEEAAAGLEADGAEVLAVATDVSDAEQMDALGAKTLERFGAVHVLCNNAGVGASGRVWELTLADWQFTLGANLWGVIHGLRVFTKHLIEQGEGHIVNTASMAGMISMPGVAPYNVSKFGVVTLSETLFGELRGIDSPVGVSVLCPSFVDTRIHESGRNRPDALQNPEDEHRTEEQKASAAAATKMMGQVLKAGLTPEEVADRVHDAIVEQRFYILTHAGTEQLVAQRAQRIAAGEDPVVPEMAVLMGRRG